MSARTVVGLSAMGVTVGLLIPVGEGMAQPRVVPAAESLGANKAAWSADAEWPRSRLSVRLRGPKSTVRQGEKVRLRGKVRGQPGARIRLRVQELTADRWVRLRGVKAGRRGRFAVRLKVKTVDQVTYRIRLKLSGQPKRVTSNHVTVPISAASTSPVTSDPTGAADPEVPAADATSSHNSPAAGMAPVEHRMVRLVNRARSRGRQCGDYGYFGPVKPLRADARLARAAGGHSRDMAKRNFFSHTGSDGSQAGTRIRREGYRYRTAGENIAAGYRTPRAAVNGLLRSPGHCRNLMSSQYTEIGVGRVARDGSSYRFYWTQNFGRLR